MDFLANAEFFEVQGNHEYNLLQWRKRGGILPDPEGRIKERYAATVKGLEARHTWCRRRMGLSRFVIAMSSVPDSLNIFTERSS